MSEILINSLQVSSSDASTENVLPHSESDDSDDNANDALEMKIKAHEEQAKAHEHVTNQINNHT